MNDDSREAFAAAIEPHFTRLYRLAYRLTGSKADAEDLLQDVLIKLYERRTELSSIRDLSPWLGRVLYNQFVDDGRRYRRNPLRLVASARDRVDDNPVDDIPALPDDEPLAGAQQHQQLDALQKALARLSEEHRAVLLMHDSEGYKLSEIQELTGVPVGTVKSRLHRARARLRELLAEHVRTPAVGVEEKSGEAPEPFAPARRVHPWTE